MHFPHYGLARTGDAVALSAGSKLPTAIGRCCLISPVLMKVHRAQKRSWQGPKDINVELNVRFDCCRAFMADMCTTACSTERVCPNCLKSVANRDVG